MGERGLREQSDGQDQLSRGHRRAGRAGRPVNPENPAPGRGDCSVWWPGCRPPSCINSEPRPSINDSKPRGCGRAREGGVRGPVGGPGSGCAWACVLGHPNCSPPPPPQPVLGGTQRAGWEPRPRSASCEVPGPPVVPGKNSSPEVQAAAGGPGPGEGRVRSVPAPARRCSPLCRDRWCVGVEAPSNMALSRKSMVDSVYTIWNTCPSSEHSSSAATCRAEWQLQSVRAAARAQIVPLPGHPPPLPAWGGWGSTPNARPPPAAEAGPDGITRGDGRWVTSHGCGKGQRCEGHGRAAHSG